MAMAVGLKLKGKPRVFGHKNGVQAVRKTISSAAKDSALKL